MEVVGHGAELAVDEVERGDEVRRGDTHKRLNDRHLRFSSSACDDVGVEAFHDRAVEVIALLEVGDDGLPFDAEGEHEEGGTPSCAVLTLCAMPEDTAVCGRLDDETEESGVLELRELAADEGGVHIGCHHLHLRIEGVVDDMFVEFEERLVGNGFAGLLLRTHVNGRQEVVLHAIYLPVGHHLELVKRPEIEDPAEVILAFQPLYVSIGSVVQMGGPQQSSWTYGTSSGADDAAEVTGIDYVIEKNSHVELSV